MAVALKIEGRHGQHALINGIYEPTTRKHNDRGVWVSRAVRPLYLFHTGKARWVISKRLDDGTKCYAFIQHIGSDPTKAEGNWTCCDQDGAWRIDTNVTLTIIPASNDMFVQLRMAMDQELDTYGLNDIASLKLIWKRLDMDGNNIVSLAEVGKFVDELVKGGAWPKWLNNQPALMRAFKKADLKDGDGDGWIEKWELYPLLLNIFWFNKLWEIFDLVDTGDDRRIDLNEFIQGISHLDLKLTKQEAVELFNDIDRNHGGQILFVEFCAYIRKRMNPEMNSNDADIISGENCCNVAQKRSAQSHPKGKSTDTRQQGHIITKAMRSFNELENKITTALKDKGRINEMWQRIDYNGNGIVSLAEIDKYVVENFHLLDHKPALMRAYKATCSAGDQQLVPKKYFKRLLSHIFYFNKIFWFFDHMDVDNDRRLTFEEFRWFINISNLNMSEKQIRDEFNQVDQNGGGVILFDEFCKYFTQKTCPECLADLLD